MRLVSMDNTSTPTSLADAILNIVQLHIFRPSRKYPFQKKIMNRNVLETAQRSNWHIAGSAKMNG